MINDTPMTDLLYRYGQGTLSRDQLETKLFLYLTEHARRYRLQDWDAEERMDYLCWLYPRLHRAIDNYRDTGASFDAYIQTLVHWSSREYRINDTLRQTMEHTLWKARFADAVHEGESTYAESKPALPLIKNRRQILILALKSYRYVSDDFLERIAPAIGVQKDYLQNLLQAMRKKRQAKDAEIQAMAERVDAQYYRCLLYLQQSRGLPPATSLYASALQRYAKAKDRLTLMRRRLASFRRGATNQEVAEILGLRKGTIDSSLYYVRWRWPVNHE
jgi:hypothetical protein